MLLEKEWIALVCDRFLREPKLCFISDVSNLMVIGISLLNGDTNVG